jgi:adenosylmethionine-8-amino-7-oxononanoate aminotransferase
MKGAAEPLPVASTAGTRIVLEDGRQLIDGIASWWTACHGYNHPHIVQAIQDQVQRAPHVMFGGLAHEPAYRLAKRLAGLLPGDLDHVFFAESGSVAVEIALKMAIQYWINQGVRERTRFVSFRGGYHGDTLATMSICDPEEGMHTLFAGVMPTQHVVKLPRTREDELALDDLLVRESRQIAGMIVEPRVQGAGGMIFHDDDVLVRLRRMADRHGILLIFDEVFTGFGRTGSLFVCEGTGVTPDIITLSKALTGGTLPLSAAIATRRVFEAFWSDDPRAALMHGPTFMANPLACAAANASLDLFEDGARLDDVARIERVLQEGLAPCRDLSVVANVRTRGAIGVVELRHPLDVDELSTRLVDEGVWIRPMGKVLYLTPAFVITDAELSVITTAIKKVLTAMRPRTSGGALSRS